MAKNLIINWLDECDSTNSSLVNYSLQKTELKLGEVYCLAAHKQLAGKGRRQKYWLSENINNIYCSVCITIANNPTRLGLNSLVAALSISETLSTINPNSDLGCKWPNDIFCNGKKIGGLLLEVGQSNQQLLDLIVGFGINLYPTNLPESSSLFLQHLHKPMGQKQNYTHTLVKNLTNAISSFNSKSSSSVARLRKKWEQQDIFFKQAVRIVSEKYDQIGSHCGIDEYGRIKLQTDAGMKCFSAGEVSLRQAS